VGISQIFDNGTNVGIGTTSVSGTYEKLTVAGGISIKDNTNAKFEIGRYNTTGAQNSYIKLGANSNSLRFTNNTDTLDLMELTNSGNLGLGVTPSTWTLFSGVIELNGGTSLGAFANITYFNQNAVFNNGWKYVNSNAAGRYELGQEHKWFNAPSGTTGNAITFTQAMTLFSTGNLLVGTPSPISDNGARLQVNGTTTFSSSVTIQGGNSLFVNNAANTRSGYLKTSGEGTELSSFAGAGEPLILIAPDTTATMRFYTGGSTGANERMRITNSGITIVGHTAGVGTNFSPPIQVKGGAGIGNGFGIISGNNEMVGGLQLASSGTNSLNIAADPDNLRSSSEIGFTIDGSIKMIIKSNGFVGIGIDPLYLLHIPQDNNIFLSNLFVGGTANNPRLSSGATGGSMSLEGGGAEEGKIYLQGAGSGGNGYIEFYAGGSLRMTISDNGSIGAPSGTNIYNPSDLRLKRNISPISNGLDKISALNPVKFNWIDGFEPSEDGKDMLGFVAQEVYEVIPEAIESFSGNSIKVNNIEIQNPLRVNEKFIIPVLVKAIQELKAENETLKSRIEVLEQS
jgi:hypothetical protein